MPLWLPYVGQVLEKGSASSTEHLVWEVPGGPMLAPQSGHTCS